MITGPRPHAARMSEHGNALCLLLRWARTRPPRRRFGGLVDFAKLGAGQVRYRTADVTLDAALHNVESIILLRICSRGPRYIYDSCGPSPTLCADREKLHQIVLNLLSNSTKFTEEGGNVTGLCDVHGKSVCISVRDTGVGVAAEKLQSEFEPFVQVGRKLSQPATGAGFGLAMSRDLARGMGGDVAAESSKAGSTFALTLPCVQNHDPI